MQHVLVVGLGSIGCRHVNILRKLGVERIDACRTGKSTVTDIPAVTNVFFSLDDAIKERPEGVLVCNPTSEHMAAASKCIEAGLDVLVEKPLCSSVSDAMALKEKALQWGVRVNIAYNMRYHPIVRELKVIGTSHAELGELLATRLYFGSYLPDWHPWEDYRSGYAARKDLGGGAGLTSIHELDFAQWLWGDITESKRMVSTKKTLGTDVDETSTFLLRHRSGVISTICLSISEQARRREISMTFERGRIEIDLLNGEWKQHDKEGGAPTRTINTDMNETYLLQDRDFIEGLDSSSSPLGSLDDAMRALSVLES